MVDKFPCNTVDEEKRDYQSKKKGGEGDGGKKRRQGGHVPENIKLKEKER